MLHNLFKKKIKRERKNIEEKYKKEKQVEKQLNF